MLEELAPKAFVQEPDELDAAMQTFSLCPITQIVRPLETRRQPFVSDRDSGLATYRMTLDGKAFAETTDTRLTLPELRGTHRVAVVAVDRAGNRSRPGAVLLHIG